MSRATCPTRDELAMYLLGKSPDGASDKIADHLERCVTCQTELETLDGLDDTFIAALRDPAASGASVCPPELEEILSQSVGLIAATHSNSFPGSEPPQQIRDYQLQAKIGEGGMGAVYKAFHVNLKRVVAVKLLGGRLVQNERAVQRFRREMEAVGKLAHPNIVLAYDAGQHDGTQFLAMEYVDGVDLSRLVKVLGPLPLSAACEIIRQAALALGHAHEHGLIHRDIKPSNLMLTRSGTVKLLDLGLARLYEDFDAGGELTTEGQPMGTLDYMAPEQGHDSRHVDVRADVYSLGATLYKLLSSRSPLALAARSTPLARLHAIVHEAPPPIGDSRPDVPDTLAQFLTQMLAKDKAVRPATAAEVAGQLAPFCVGHDLVGMMDHYSTRALESAFQSEQSPSPANRALPLETPGQELSLSQEREAMAAPAEFDPYYRWLGIPPHEQPPTHYRLLGLQVFETNGEVIDAAADRQMAYVRTMQTGKHAELSQRLLNEIAVAKMCLLQQASKSAYDASLRAKLATQAAPSAPARTGVVPGTAGGNDAPAAAQPQLVTRKGPATVPVATALPVAEWLDDVGQKPPTNPARRATAPKPPNRTRVGLWIGGLGGAAVFLAAVFVIRLTTGMGEVVIESTDPGVQVEVRRNGATVDTLTLAKNEHRITVRTGEYEIVLKGENSDELVIENDTFTLERGGQKIVKITHRKSPDVVANVDPQGHKKASPPPPTETPRPTEPKIVAANNPVTPEAAPPKLVAKKVEPNTAVPPTTPAANHSFRGQRMAKVTVQSTQVPLPLKINPDPKDQERWTAIPQDLQNMLQQSSPDGKLSFEVTEPGIVLLVVTSRWGGGGNASGGWVQELTTRDQFIAQGWKQVDELGHASPHNYQFKVFARDSQAGEKFSIRTEKYVAPILLLPDPAAPEQPIATYTPKGADEPGKVPDPAASRVMCKVLAGKQFPAVELAKGAIPFRAPNGDGRIGAHGFVISAPAGWQNRGTVWSCKYRRSGTARGIHFIHPIDNGHLLVAIATGGIAAGSITRWPGGDPSPFDANTSMHLEWRIDPTKLVLDMDEPHELRSELSADGMLQVHIDGNLLVTGNVVGVRPLELANENFQGEGLERKLAPGLAGVVIGPLDNGTNKAEDLQLGLGASSGSVAKNASAKSDPNDQGDGEPQQRQPVPDEAARKPVLEQVRDLFKAQYASAKSPAQKADLAKKLLQQAEETQANPIDRFVLLDEARRLASEAGDIDKGLEAINAISSSYEGDPWALKLAALIAANTGVKGSDVKDKSKSLSAAALAIAQDAVSADQYETAQQASDVALAAARRARDAALTKTTAERTKEIAEITASYRAAKDSFAVLEKESTDQAANLTVGKFLCFIKGQWPEGLPHLASSSDEELKAAAVAEIESPADGPGQAAIADQWWKVAQGERGKIKERLEGHAAGWYMQSVAGLAGLERARVERRIAELDRKGILDSTESLRQRVTAYASGCNGNTVYVNEKQLLHCRREQASSAPVTLKVGDVIAVHVGDRFDVMSHWMMFVSQEGRCLFETSDDWYGYLPTDPDRWWNIADSNTKRVKSQYAPDTREYVDQVKAAARAAVPKLKPGQPIFSPLMGKKQYSDAYLYHIVTAKDLAPKGSAPTASSTSRTGKTYYVGMLGKYKHRGADIPFVMLTVPDGKNVLTEAVVKRMRDKFEVDVAVLELFAVGHLMLPKDGTYHVEGGRAVTVAIDGRDLALDNYGRQNGADVTLKRGDHRITISVINNGGQLGETSVRIVDQSTEQTVPIVITREEAKALMSAPIAGAKPIEVSGWEADKNAVRVNAVGR